MNEERHPLRLPRIVRIPSRMQHDELERSIVVKTGWWIPMSTCEWVSKDSTRNYLTLVQTKPARQVIDGCEHYIKLSEHERILAECEEYYQRRFCETLLQEISKAFCEVAAGFVAKFELFQDIQWIQAQQDVLGKKASYLEAMEKRLQERQAQVYQSRPASTPEGFVYLIKDRHSKHWKIGRTKNVKDRIRLFGVKLPFEVKLAHTIRCKDMYTAERSLHMRYAAKRLKGEWFALTPEDVEEIKQIDEL